MGYTFATLVTCSVICLANYFIGGDAVYSAAFGLSIGSIIGQALMRRR